MNEHYAEFKERMSDLKNVFAAVDKISERLNSTADLEGCVHDFEEVYRRCTIYRAYESDGASRHRIPHLSQGEETNIRAVRIAAASVAQDYAEKIQESCLSLADRLADNDSYELRRDILADCRLYEKILDVVGKDDRPELSVDLGSCLDFHTEAVKTLENYLLIEQEYSGFRLELDSIDARSKRLGDLSSELTKLAKTYRHWGKTFEKKYTNISAWKKRFKDLRKKLKPLKGNVHYWRKQQTMDALIDVAPASLSSMNVSRRQNSQVRQGVGASLQISETDLKDVEHHEERYVSDEVVQFTYEVLNKSLENNPGYVGLFQRLDDKSGSCKGLHSILVGDAGVADIMGRLVLFNKKVSLMIEVDNHQRRFLESVYEILHVESENIICGRDAMHVVVESAKSTITSVLGAHTPKSTVNSSQVWDNNVSF